MSSLEIIPVQGIGEVLRGDNLGELITRACSVQGLRLQTGDIVCVTHKIVSKSEGRVLSLSDITPSKFAIKAARHIQKEPQQVEVILSESRRIVKMVRGLIISETPQGFVCANAGVDQSNVEMGKILLLPRRPDETAKKIRTAIRKRTKRDVAVIITDTFGRPWREGQVDVAIGLSGIDPFTDYRGRKDQYGFNLKASVICVADELASAAELCMNKLDRVPVAIIRGYHYRRADIPARALARRPVRDLFR
ncbi:MAG: coenzyme F420-0:L-glutamate ligase [Nitrososphaerota archaeon]|nr:coenzyme F420-0:L-glutamate ligase [Nitrososphaerota archaeon]MDG6922394.1 coenzyme F420-0:L-glutamate ligase [Nitrososphaerota archaeon]